MRNEASSADQPGQTIRQAIDREKTDKRQSNKKTECNRMQTFSKFESGAVASDILVIVRGSVPKHQRHRQLKKKKKKKECTRDVNEDQTTAAATGTTVSPDTKLSAATEDESCVIGAGSTADIWDGTGSALVETEIERVGRTARENQSSLKREERERSERKIREISEISEISEVRRNSVA